MVAALKRIGERDHRPTTCRATREVTDGIRIDLADVRRPFRCLRSAVAFAREITREHVKPGAAAVEKILVVQSLGVERVRHPEEHRSVGVWAELAATARPEPRKCRTAAG